MTSPNLSQTELENFATAPFSVLEELGLAAGYERSFKLSKKHISANRYLLGIELDGLSDTAIETILCSLNMPKPLYRRFQADRAQANLLLIGFDLNGSSPIYKIYLEYWDQIQAAIEQHPSSEAPHLMHRGYKWPCNQPQKTLVTDYQYLPKLTHSDVLHQVEQVFAQHPSTCHQASSAIINSAYAALPASAPESIIRYLSISEENNQRKSFDLNLYPAQLAVGEIEQTLSDLIAHWEISRKSFEQLMTLVRSRPLGHISAGLGRDGEEYLTIYYDYG